MFYVVAMAALAAGSLFAVAFHLRQDHPQWRRELTLTMAWSAVAFAVLFGWLTFEAVQDWVAAAEDSEGVAAAVAPIARNVQ